ncbi:MAG TPA: DNA polymerase III subunit delta [Phycisphaerales bacterium]|nr:DNA polymerase III subunit delta [Phycisphaerales bacterium]HIB50266.1 DNA polymerase III subunit delta [Phycisphaerales bacterium]HIN83468.1 DNA polymerase III subunit delta [Phycisphaerales bacterium]HIO19677.1 DNA polymerase III subunit delta [Phycisphaerales bacterium]HIO52684.1 DNA polymerase III subunit delta [Phycisphaerales bacterium]
MAKQPTFKSSMRMAIIHGKESFLMSRYTSDFESAIAEEFGDVDRVVFDGATTDLATILDEVRTFDLMMRHKLVVVDNADVFLVTKDSVKTSNRQALERYAESPVQSATLLLRAPTWRPGKLDKAVAKVGIVVKLQNLNELDSIRWCVGRCGKEHGCTLEAQAAQFLVQRIGVSLTRLDTELGKLSAKVAPETKITKADVAEMVGLSREEQAWEIQSIILSGNSGAAMTKLGELLDVSRQPKELLMWSVVDLTRRLSAASTMMQNGLSAGDIRKNLKLFGDGGNRILQLAKQRTPSELANLFTEAVAVDARTRSGLLDGRRGLELITLRVCREIK